jgi:signal peptidase I
MRIVNVIRWILVAALVVVLVLPVIWTIITKQDFVKVDGESMEPVYSIGDIILVGPASQSDFQPGHVLTVRNDSGQLYTHRVVSVDADGNAQLKGDGNSFEDPGTVTFASVAGAVRHHIDQPAASAFLLISTWPARISVLVLILGLMFAPLSPRSEDTTGTDADETDNPEASDAPLDSATRSSDSAHEDTRVFLQELGLPAHDSSHYPDASQSSPTVTRRSLRKSTRYRRTSDN